MGGKCQIDNKDYPFSNCYSKEHRAGEQRWWLNACHLIKGTSLAVEFLIKVIFHETCSNRLSHGKPIQTIQDCKIVLLFILNFFFRNDFCRQRNWPCIVIDHFDPKCVVKCSSLISWIITRSCRICRIYLKFISNLHKNYF